MSYIKKLFKNEMVLYLISGGVTTLVNWCTYALITTTGNSIYVANIVAWFVGVLVAFVLNKMMVFRSKSKSIWKQFISFCGSRLFTGAIEVLLFPVLVMVPLLNEPIFSVQGMGAKIIITVIVTILNYIFGRVIFKNKELKNKTNKENME